MVLVVEMLEGEVRWRERGGFVVYDGYGGKVWCDRVFEFLCVVEFVCRVGMVIG